MHFFLSGIPPSSGTSTVEITVTDVNDVVPALDQTEYSVAIEENSVPGDTIALVWNKKFLSLIYCQ